MAPAGHQHGTSTAPAKHQGRPSAAPEQHHCGTSMAPVGHKLDTTLASAQHQLAVRVDSFMIPDMAFMELSNHFFKKLSGKSLTIYHDIFVT